MYYLIVQRISTIYTSGRLDTAGGIRIKPDSFRYFVGAPRLVLWLGRATARQAAFDPHRSPQIPVFRTSSVLPAKLTPGVSDQDQIHRYSDTPPKGPKRKKFRT